MSNITTTTDRPLDDHTGTEASQEREFWPAEQQPQVDSFESELGSLNEDALASVLDAHRHDSTIHQALIALEQLPVAIADRLWRLVTSPSLREQLMMKHPLSPGSDRDLVRMSRDRPAWWRGHVRNAFL